MQWVALTRGPVDSQPPVWDDGPSEGHLPVAVAARLGEVLGPPHRRRRTTASSGAGTASATTSPRPRCHPGSCCAAGRTSSSSAARSATPPATSRPSRTSRARTSGGRPTAPWCVVTDIDLMSTYVGGSAACIAELFADAGLEASPAAPATRRRRTGRPFAARPEACSRAVRLIVVRVLAVLCALTWLVLPGFGLIDLSVTWDPDWPVVLEASWGLFMTVLVGGSFLAVAVRPSRAAPATVTLLVAAGLDARLGRRRAGVAAARVRGAARRWRRRCCSPSIPDRERVRPLTWSVSAAAAGGRRRSGSCRGWSTPSGCSRANRRDAGHDDQ